MGCVGVCRVCRRAVWQAQTPPLPSLCATPCSTAPAATGFGKPSEGAQDFVQVHFTPFCIKKKRPCMVRTCSSDPSRPAANREGNGEHGEPVPASKQGYSGDPGSRAEGEQPLGTPRSPCAAQVVAGSQPTFLTCLAPGLGCSSASLFIPDSLFIPGLFLSHISSSRCLTSSSQPFLISVFWAGGITIYWQHLGNISCLISLNCMCRSRGNSWYRELHPQPLIMPLRCTNRHI